MKIVVLGTRGFPGVQGGVESHCEHLYRHLAKRGCQVTVFMRQTYITPQSDSIPGITAISLSCPKNKYLEAIIHTYKSVWAARRLKPDIVHIHAIGPSVLTPLVRMLGMKVVVTHHGPDYERKKWGPFAKIFLRFCEWAGTVFANAVITIARNIAEDLKKNFGRTAFIIPNGVEIPPLSEKEDALKPFGLEKNRYVLTVGRLVPEKGFDVLAEAFKRSHPQGWKLAIVGGADFEDPYSRDLKQKLSGEADIVLTGLQRGEALRQLYSHAGLFVLASSYEGLPIVLLEALSYGLSCVASGIPANRNIALGEERFFPAGDGVALSSRLEKFAGHPLTEEERNKQLRMIAEEYNWEKIADSTLAVYRHVLSVHIQ